MFSEDLQYIYLQALDVRAWQLDIDDADDDDNIVHYSVHDNLGISSQGMRLLAHIPIL